MASVLNGSCVLLTGASSGIGLEFAREVAGRASKVILVARRTEKLLEVKDELLRLNPKLEVVIEGCDLASVVNARALAQKVLAEHSVDVLINNAGIGNVGIFERCDLDKVLSMIELNISSLVALARALLPPMVARKSGGILNVSSGAGLAVMPGLSAYTGTKYFVTGFTEALALELAGTGVHVTQLCPGPVPTEFEQAAGNTSEYHAPKLIEVTANYCARVALAGLEANRPMVVPGAVITGLLWLATTAPRWLLRASMRPIAAKFRRNELARVADANRDVSTPLK
jgi:uncharacterized protein